jgi:hypothetical protein
MSLTSVTRRRSPQLALSRCEADAYFQSSGPPLYWESAAVAVTDVA